MRRNLLVWVAGAVIMGCSSTTEPAKPAVVHTAVIKDISLPARAALMDTVRVGFTFVTPSCDTDFTVESRQTGDGMRFTARSVANNLPCVFDIINVHHAG